MVLVIECKGFFPQRFLLEKLIEAIDMLIKMFLCFLCIFSNLGKNVCVLLRRWILSQCTENNHICKCTECYPKYSRLCSPFLKHCEVNFTCYFIIFLRALPSHLAVHLLLPHGAKSESISVSASCLFSRSPGLFFTFVNLATCSCANGDISYHF